MRKGSKGAIFVTGASGLIGKSVVRHLLEEGYKVKAFLRPDSLTPFYPHPQLTIARGSMEDKESLVRATKGCEAVVHLAANQYHPRLSFEVNVKGIQNLTHAMKKNGASRLINMSTLATRISHKGVYGKTKQEADEIVKSSGLDWTILKPSLVYGDDPKTIFQTIAAFVRGLPIVPVLGGGTLPFRPVWVEDVAEAVVRSLRLPRSLKKTYDIGSKESLSFNELVAKIQKALGKHQPLVHVPYWLSLLGAWGIGKVMKDPPISIDNVLGSNQPTFCRPEKALKDLKLKPLSVDEGINLVVREEGENKLPVAVVGLGKMGTLHSGILSTFPNVVITAVVDKDKKLGKTILSMGLPSRFYTTLEEALEHEPVKAVFITTPTFAHKEIIDICLKRRLPFFVEKPVFPNWQCFEEIKKQKKIKDTVAATGYFYSFRRPYVLAKKLIDKGILGKLQNFQAKLLISEVFGEKHGWMFKKNLSGGGVLMNPGPHVFGVLESFFGSPAAISARLRSIYSKEVEDEGRIALAYASGIKGKIFTSWSKKGAPLTSVRVSVRGENGSMEVDEQGIKLFLKDGSCLATASKIIPISRTRKPLFIPSSEIEKPGAGKPVFVLSPAAGGEGYALEDRTFINCVVNKKKFPNDLEFAGRVEKAIALAYLSENEGRKVKWDEI